MSRVRAGPSITDWSFTVLVLEIPPVSQRVRLLWSSNAASMCRVRRFNELINSVNSAELPTASLGFHVTFESRRRLLNRQMKVSRVCPHLLWERTGPVQYRPESHGARRLEGAGPWGALLGFCS